MLSRYNISLPSLSTTECNFLKNVCSQSTKKTEDVETTSVYKNLKLRIILHGPPKCWFKCPHKLFLWLSYFSVLGLNWQTNSDCPPFGALASLSCCSSGSQIFFLANRIIIQHQFFLYSSLPGKELENSEKMYSNAVEVRAFSTLVLVVLVFYIKSFLTL